MIGRIIDINQNKRHLSLYRGFLIVEHQREEQGRIPLDDIAAVVVSGHGITHSSNLLAALAERGIPFVLCASNHHPVGMLWATDSYYRQSGRMDAQLTAAKPFQKKLWQQIVTSKLLMQAIALEAIGAPAAPLLHMATKVRSGDPDNMEAQGARAYWSLLFGTNFRRDREAPGINTFLNYGYAILRSATARAIMAVGLHPGLGLHHQNVLNPMRLVDDLMEPYRPLVDLRVYGLSQSGMEELSTHNKKHLADVLYHDLPSSSGTTPVMGSVYRLAHSLAQSYEGKTKNLELPSQTITTRYLHGLSKLQ